jgi:hypothetical protein
VLVAMSVVHLDSSTEKPAAAGRPAILRWLARGLFVAAAAWAVTVWWMERSHPLPPPRPVWHPAWRGVDWSRVEWQTWRSRSYGLSLYYPGVWSVEEPFEKMVETPLGDLKKAPVAGFRGDTPVVLFRYLAPGPASWEAWRGRLDTQPDLLQEFGSTVTARRPATVSGQPALELEGEGAVRGSLWHFRSLYFARGPLAFRLTAGADVRDWPAMDPIFQRVLESVRWEPATVPDAGSR